MAEFQKSVLTFKDIDINAIIEEYNRGGFAQSSMKHVQPSTVTCGANNLLKQNPTDCQTTFKGSYGSKVSLFSVSSNTDRCFWDHHKFNHQGIGLPISMFQKVHLKDDKEVIHYAFETIYNFCSFECMYSFFQSFKISNTQKQWLTENSEHFINTMFNLLFPGKTLRQAPHWLLLVRYSGHLPIKSFRQDHSEYYSCSKISLSAINNEYIKNESTK